jgi:hypothetical protein
MAEAWAIKHDDAMILSSEVNQAAAFEILNHAAVAMQQDDRVACAPFDKMEAHAVHLNKLPSRRVISLGLFCGVSVEQGG